MLKEWNDQEARTREVRRVLDAGRTRRAGDRADQQAVRWAAPTGRAGAGSARRREGDRARRTDHRTRPRRSATTAEVHSPRSDTETTVLLSTHQTEDVAALCERVVVLAGGTIQLRRYGHATWSPPRRARSGSPTRLATTRGEDSWRTGTGRYRVVGGKHDERYGSCRADAGGRLPTDARTGGRSIPPGTDPIAPLPRHHASLADPLRRHRHGFYPRASAHHRPIGRDGPTSRCAG